MIDFPANPTVGQTFTSAGVTWTWDGIKWTFGGTVGPPVTVAPAAPSGALPGALWWDSVGGQLYLYFNDGTSSQWVIVTNITGAQGPQGPAGPQGATGPAGATGPQGATGPGTNENRIINGDMRIDQRNNGASGTAINVYTVDRWAYNATQPAKGSWSRQSVGPPGFPYSLIFQSASAYALLAGDTFYFAQYIEADMVSDFAWGTAAAQPATLSFWAFSSLTGTFSGAVCNHANTRSYPFTFLLSAASTWTKIAITIPGDIAGTWVMSGNGGAVDLRFDLGSGATYHAAAGAWVNGNFVGVTGSVNVVGTNAATFYLTGVKLEIGSVATPYNWQSLAKSMADCQRYYEFRNYTIFSGNITSGPAYYAGASYAATKRAVPTLTFGDLGNNGFPTGAPTINSNFVDGYSVSKLANATVSGGFFSFSLIASAEL